MGRKMKHTEVGDIPADWEVQTFEETFRILTNNTLSRADLNDREGTIRNIHYGDILTRYSEVLDCDNEDIPFLNSSSLLIATAMPLQDGDVILADTAEDETVGKATEVYRLGEKKMVAGLHTIPCRVKKGNFAPRWLGYYMNSHAYHDQVLPYITGIKVSSISKSAIAKTMILIPPALEQEKIVAVLSEIDALIANLEKLVEKYEAIKQGCLGCMFPRSGQTVPERRLPGFTGDWEQRKLGNDLISIQTGTNKLGNESNKGMALLKMGNIQRGFFSLDKLEYLTEDDPADSKDIAYYGDFFFNTRNTLELVGKGATWTGESGKYAFNNNIARFQLKNLDTIFFNYLYNTETLLKQVHARAMGTTSVAAIYPHSLDSITYLVPQIEEQRIIGKFLLNFDQLITLNQRKTEKYKMIKQGVMSELLTGKIRLI